MRSSYRLSNVDSESETALPTPLAHRRSRGPFRFIEGAWMLGQRGSDISDDDESLFTQCTHTL